MLGEVEKEMETDYGTPWFSFVEPEKIKCDLNAKRMKFRSQYYSFFCVAGKVAMNT